MGHARCFSGASEESYPTYPMGDVFSVAPEMYELFFKSRGDRTSYNPYFTQWWALGVLLYTAYFGQHPFWGRDLTLPDRAYKVAADTTQLRRQDPYYFNRNTLIGWFLATRKENLDAEFRDSELEILLKSLLNPNPWIRGEFCSVSKSPWLASQDWRKLQFELISRIAPGFKKDVWKKI